MLWRNRRLIGNPRYGVVGLGVIPYILVFEGLGPLLEICRVRVDRGRGVARAAELGGVRRDAGRVGAVRRRCDLLALFMSDVATQRYMTGRDLMLLVVVVLLESCGYRQMNAWWGCVGTVKAATGGAGWGVIRRRAFGNR